MTGSPDGIEIVSHCMERRPDPLDASEREPGPDVQSVTVCIATRDREERLLALLRSIRTAVRPAGCELRLVIVDNGATPLLSDGPALEGAVGAAVTLLAESRPGIPQTRNAGVAAAMPTDFVVFVDDDEEVSPGWLEHLVAVQRATGADVVTGPVIATYPPGAPGWAAASGVYERPRRPTGTRLDTAATNNTLVRAAVFEAMPSWFDERLALTGGSDSEFFRRVHHAGFTIVWADEAVVTEAVSPERLVLGWVLRRNYRIGIGMARNIQAHDPRRRFRRMAKQTWIALVRLGKAGLAVPGDRARAIALLAQAARATGRVAGLIGLSYDEYA